MCRLSVRIRSRCAGIKSALFWETAWWLFGQYSILGGSPGGPFDHIVRVRGNHFRPVLLVGVSCLYVFWSLAISDRFWVIPGVRAGPSTAYLVDTSRGPLRLLRNAVADNKQQTPNAMKMATLHHQFHRHGPDRSTWRCLSTEARPQEHRP